MLRSALGGPKKAILLLVLFPILFSYSKPLRATDCLPNPTTDTKRMKEIQLPVCRGLLYR